MELNAAHQRLIAQNDLERVPHVSMDYGFCRMKESKEQMSPVRPTSHDMNMK